MAGALDGGTLGVGGGAASTTIASATIGYQWQSSIRGGPWVISEVPLTNFYTYQ